MPAPSYPQPRIITCDQWGARPPKAPVTPAGKPDETVFHHTFGHVPNLSAGETLAEALAYARSIQRFHMDVRGWNDSGHNLLVTRGGFILEGRHGSVAAISAGRMVVSAHCPGHNSSPGVEHEHLGEPHMTALQLNASVELHAWIADRCRIPIGELAKPHGDLWSTTCPAELRADIPQLRVYVGEALAANRDLTSRTGWFAWAAWRLGEGDWRPYGPANPAVRPDVPESIAPAWWVRLREFLADRKEG